MLQILFFKTGESAKITFFGKKKKEYEIKLNLRISISSKEKKKLCNYQKSCIIYFLFIFSMRYLSLLIIAEYWFFICNIFKQNEDFQVEKNIFSEIRKDLSKVKNDFKKFEEKTEVK